MDILLHILGFGLVLGSAVYMLGLKKYDKGLYLFMAAFGTEALRGLLTHHDPLLILFALSGMGIIWLLIDRDKKKKQK